MIIIWNNRGQYRIKQPTHVYVLVSNKKRNCPDLFQDELFNIGNQDHSFSLLIISKTTYKGFYGAL